MIYLIVGTNAYEAEQQVQKYVRETGLEPEYINSSQLDTSGLADIVRGGSLFSRKRLVIIRHLSDNTMLWKYAAEWASEVGDDTTILIVEPTLDRRTKAYKLLVKAATVIRVDPMTERQRGMAEAWLDMRAHAHHTMLSSSQIHDMVSRALITDEQLKQRVVDQFQLHHALASLAALHTITDADIEAVLPKAVTDTVFDLLATAVKRDEGRLHGLLTELRRNEDPHRVFALLASQWAQLVSLALIGGRPDAAAAALGVHPFVAGKLQDLARTFSHDELHELTRRCAELDAGIKNSQFGPWDGIEQFLAIIALRPSR